MDDKRRYVNEKQWLEFLAPLNTAEAGSKIILTSRQGLWKSTSLLTRLFPLNGLNDDDSWSLFEMCAFDSENQHKRPELEPIGKEIVKNLKGLSLAIRVVGTQLGGNSDEEEWRALKDNPLDTSDVMNSLRLSYEHLPQHLKHCFAYCSIFPKDYRFKPDRLVQMWIAQGFVFPEEGKKFEDVGKLYFKGLLARSFFQVIKLGSKEYYVMHDIMNDLACHVSKGECYRLEKGDPMTNLGSIRHLSVTYEAMDILMNIPGLDKLRTLMILGSCEDIIDIPNNLTFERIRALDLEHGISNLDIIGNCKHLRYLSLRNINRLPDCFTQLHHLNVLFVRKNVDVCPTPIVLPKFSCSLQFIDFSKSVYLDFDEQVEQIVPKLFRGGYVKLDLENKKGYGLDVLGDMDNIKGIIKIVGLNKVTSTEEASKAQLQKKQSVTELHLNWHFDTHPTESDEISKCQQVCDALVPNRNLESLVLTGFKGAAWPSWLGKNLLSSVKSIVLFWCREATMLPPLGQLPLLKKLKIESLFSVRKIGLEFYGKDKFPSLEDLCIYNLESLEEWCYPCDTSVFPKLNKLIFGGVQLECFSLPQYIQIRLTKLNVSDCEKLITLEGLNELVSLQEFFIEKCPNLSSLPEMKRGLQCLAILDCPKLNWLPSLPVALRVLCVCGAMQQSLKSQIENRKRRKRAVTSYEGEWIFLSTEESSMSFDISRMGFADNFCENFIKNFGVE